MDWVKVYYMVLLLQRTRFRSAYLSDCIVTITTERSRTAESVVLHQAKQVRVYVKGPSRPFECLLTTQIILPWKMILEHLQAIYKNRCV